MKNWLIPTVLLIALLFIAASCGGDTTKKSTGGYVGGIDGLSIKYALDSPPDKVMDADQETFPITLDIENKGEYTIQAGEIIATVTGIDLVAFGITTDTKKNTAFIEGKKKTSQDVILSGGKSTELTFDTGYKQDLPADQQFTIMTNLCYRYQTKATASMCLRKEVTKKGDEKDVCKVSDPLTASNSGAPLQIVSMSQSPAGTNKMSLVIEIENKGPGVAYLAPEALSVAKCSETATNLKDYKNKIKITVEFTDKKPAVSCGALKGSNTGTLTLVGGKTARLTCEMDTNGLQETTFNKNPNVILDYVYKDSVSKSIMVQNIA